LTSGCGQNWLGPLYLIPGKPSYLGGVAADGPDREARTAMMVAATQAAIAFSDSSVALVHGMSHPIGATSTLRTACRTRCSSRP
jgi:hypothetical protein